MGGEERAREGLNLADRLCHFATGSAQCLYHKHMRKKRQLSAISTLTCGDQRPRRHAPWPLQQRHESQSHTRSRSSHQHPWQKSLCARHRGGQETRTVRTRSTASCEHAMAIVATRICRTRAMANTPHLPQIVSVLSTPREEAIADVCTIFRECQQGLIHWPSTNNKHKAAHELSHGGGGKMRMRMRKGGLLACTDECSSATPTLCTFVSSAVP